MVRGREGIARVARKTLLAVKRCFLFNAFWRVVRIVAAHTRHSIATGSLAFAHTQLLHFAHAAFGGSLAAVDKVSHVVCDGIPGLIVQGRMTRTLNGDISFQVTRWFLFSPRELRSAI